MHVHTHTHTHTGTTKGISEEGMPGSRHSELKGNLYIIFDVEFPENGFLDEKDLIVSLSS